MVSSPLHQQNTGDRHFKRRHSLLLLVVLFPVDLELQIHLYLKIWTKIWHFPLTKGANICTGSYLLLGSCRRGPLLPWQLWQQPSLSFPNFWFLTPVGHSVRKRSVRDSRGGFDGTVDAFEVFWLPFYMQFLERTTYLIWPEICLRKECRVAFCIKKWQKERWGGAWPLVRKNIVISDMCV